MKIEIEIPAPPDGYSVPERKPIFLPFSNTLILVGQAWVRAADVLQYGGCIHICCRKLEVNDGMG